jgi:hypothetical protein
MKAFDYIAIIVFVIGCISALIASNEQETKTFTAKCPLFVGEVTKQGDKFYNKHGKEIWLPLKECYLEEK